MSEARTIRWRSTRRRLAVVVAVLALGAGGGWLIWAVQQARTAAQRTSDL